MPGVVPLLQQIVACIGWFRGHRSLSWEPSPRAPPAAALFVCLLDCLRVALPLVASVPSALGLRITVPSSGLAPAAQAWPSFHSGPSPRRLREPLMSNVMRRPIHIESFSRVACGNFVSRRLRGWWHASFCAATPANRGVHRLVSRPPLAALASLAPRSTSRRPLCLPAGSPSSSLAFGRLRAFCVGASHNRSIERTRSGRLLQAIISFLAFRSRLREPLMSNVRLFSSAT